MLDDAFLLLTTRLESCAPVGVSSHLPGIFLRALEEELLLDLPYARQQPPNYPDGQGERLGLRRLRNPADGTYQAMPLRVGRVTLHLREQGRPDNLDAILIAYLGEADKTAVGEAVAHGARHYALIALLDNGVISASYGTAGSPAVHVNSWHPPCRPGLAAFPHPTRRGPVEELMRAQTAISGACQETRAFAALPDLVLLCADLYLASSR